MSHRFRVLLRGIAIGVAVIDVLFTPLLTFGLLANNWLLISAGILTLIASVTTLIVLRDRSSQTIPSRI
jgi:hypothetical protein